MTPKDALPFKNDDRAAAMAELWARQLKELQPAEFHKLDAPDVACWRMLPPQLLQLGDIPTQGESKELFDEGVRGKGATAARSLLARDVALARVRLRWYELQLDYNLQNISDGPRREQRIALLGKLVDQQHRRMLATMELMAKLEAAGTPTPVFKVSADTAAFQINGQAPT
ncbi:MAG: hypothetical protein PHU25_13480 [Deltaproteobacteria bacterium]|nr:hypothetical protein [Deltaproteobacteria bacterium]